MCLVSTSDSNVPHLTSAGWLAARRCPPATAFDDDRTDRQQWALQGTDALGWDDPGSIGHILRTATGRSPCAAFHGAMDLIIIHVHESWFSLNPLLQCRALRSRCKAALQ
jgi:hypothetical protein